jgi:hypothetical protein
VVLEHCGHYVADEAPEGMLEALQLFLAPFAAERQAKISGSRLRDRS